jgi:hypothetical protein
VVAPITVAEFAKNSAHGDLTELQTRRGQAEFLQIQL